MTAALENIKSINIKEWLTLATAPSPTKLQTGQTPYAYNTWVDEKPGSVITAPGFVKVGTLPSGNPPTFSINYFKTSAGTQIYVVSDNATVWTTVDFQTFTSIITGLSQFFQLRGAVIRDKLWLTNSNDTVYTFDGVTATPMDGTLASLVIQDITYKWNAASLVSPSQITIAYLTGGTAGSEVVTVTGSVITVEIQSGVSTATQVLAAVNASTAALALISASISGTGSHAQTAPTAATALSGGRPLVPKGAYIAYHDERVWMYQLPSNRSMTQFSALTDANANIIDPDDPAAWPNDNTLQISEGDADYGTGVLLYRGFLHFFKQYSIWRLVGYDEYTYSRVKTRASTGTRFNESLQVMDSLVHFIGIDGIYVFDGEETDRISDIIDPATAEQASFGFNQLQQPNTNNNFWEVTATADWNAGTVPRNLAVNNQLALQAADDSETDFLAGTLTNVDATTNPGFLQLAQQSSGGSAVRIGQGINSFLDSSVGMIQIGQPNWLTDGDTSRQVGLNSGGNSGLVRFVVDLTADHSAIKVGRIIVRGLAADASNVNLQIQVNVGAYQAKGTTVGSWTTVGTVTAPVDTPTDETFDFSIQTGCQVSIFGFLNSNYVLVCTEIEAYSPAFVTSGSFTSRTLDLGNAPASLGNFFCNFANNGQGLTFQTQTSADGSTWDSAVSVTNAGAIGSTARRYIRWIANFTSDGSNSQIIDNVWLGSIFVSAVHDTGGNIFSWGAFGSDRQTNAQTISYYYRGATTSGGVSSASWNLIVPGGAINLLTTDRYIQFKVEISGLSSGNNPPVVSNVTMNWVVGSGTQPQVLQNVASFFWRNRYWLSAAGAGATSNNTILIRGKKTFGSPWQLKDWNILSFCRYLDNLYGTSSVDGSIYQLDTGYSKGGAVLDSIFETGDFTFEGFQAQITEIMLETQRLGPYTLFVGTSTDQGQTWTDHSIDLTLPTGGTFSIWKRINDLNLTTDKLRLRFYINGIDQPFQVHNCIVYYKLSAGRGTVGVS